LIRACVPFMIITETCTETTPVNNVTEDQKQNIQQQQETIAVLQENVTQLQTDIEVMFEKQEIIPQMQMKIEKSNSIEPSVLRQLAGAKSNTKTNQR